MTWTEITPRQYRRDDLAYASDLRHRTEGFVVLSKRWIMERSFAWFGGCRRLTRDIEATISSSHAWLMIAHNRRVLQKINQTAF